MQPSTFLLILLAVAAFMGSCGAEDGESSPVRTELPGDASAGGTSAESGPGGDPSNDAGSAGGGGGSGVDAGAAAGESPGGADRPAGGAGGDEAGQEESPAGRRARAAADFEDELVTFGSEAEAGKRSEVQQVLADYLQSARRGEWGEACAHLSPIARTPLLALVEQVAHIEEKTCANGLRLSIEQLSPVGEPYFGSADVASLRIKEGGTAGEGAGFAIFQGDDGIEYWMTMRREGGEWKVVTTAPRPLRYG